MLSILKFHWHSLSTEHSFQSSTACPACTGVFPRSQQFPTLSFWKVLPDGPLVLSLNPFVCSLWQVFKLKCSFIVFETRTHSSRLAYWLSACGEGYILLLCVSLSSSNIVYNLGRFLKPTISSLMGMALETFQICSLLEVQLK